MTLTEAGEAAGLVGAVLIFLRWFFTSAADAVLEFLYNLVVVEQRVDTEMVNRTMRYLTKHGRQLGVSNSYWDVTLQYVRPLKGRFRTIREHRSAGSFAVLHRWMPIWYGRNEDCVYFRYLRGTVNWERLVREIAQEMGISTVKPRRFFIKRLFGDAPNLISAPPSSAQKEDPSSTPVQRHVGWEEGDIGDPQPTEPFEFMATSPELEHVVADAKFWLRNREWYQGRGGAFTRKYLFAGPPGMGKTSLIRALAQDLDLPMILPDLASFSNKDLASMSSEVEEAGTIVVLEDVDCIFNGRENVSNGSLTLDALLNWIAGAEQRDGLMLVMTTNHPEVLDPALLEGHRVDLRVEFRGLDQAGREKVARDILRDPEEEAKMVLSYPDGVSPASFRRACFSRALELLWGAA